MEDTVAVAQPVHESPLSLYKTIVRIVESEEGSEKSDKQIPETVI